MSTGRSSALARTTTFSRSPSVPRSRSVCDRREPHPSTSVWSRATTREYPPSALRTADSTDSVIMPTRIAKTTMPIDASVIETVRSRTESQSSSSGFATARTACQNGDRASDRSGSAARKRSEPKKMPAIVIRKRATTFAPGCHMRYSPTKKTIRSRSVKETAGGAAVAGRSSFRGKVLASAAHGTELGAARTGRLKRWRETIPTPVGRWRSRFAGASPKHSDVIVFRQGQGDDLVRRGFVSSAGEGQVIVDKV